MPELTVSPSRPTLDTPLHIRVTDLPPGSTARIDAHQRDPRGQWRSWAAYTANPDGTVDTHRDAPTAGTYRGVDPMGLIWSLQPTDEPASDRTVLTLTVGDTSTTVERLRVPDGVHVHDVREHGLVGTLCHPDGPGPWPGVLMLGGAEGGMHADDAALLAAHGFAALALAYFGAPGVPRYAMHIPLEYFGTALDYLAAHPQVRADRLAVLGGSKGSEAALLVAATFPHIRAAVSLCGSGVLTQGIGPGSFLEIVRNQVPNWTHHGKPLPYLPNIATPELVRQIEAGEPVRLQSIFTPGLDLREQLAAATIPIERTSAAVLLVSSTDDAGYGPEFHTIAADRLRACQHVIHPDAGHGIIAPPFAPTTVLTTPGPGVTFHWGGTPEANAAAKARSWTDTIDFLLLHTGQ